MKRIRTPLTKPVITKLKCGQEVFLSGTIYTARDRAHKELVKLIIRRKRLPFDLKGAVIYYAGPTPRRTNGLFGSCGPTTSSRMDKFTPILLGKGLSAMIGKGGRAKDVRDLIKRKKAVYFLAIGGAGAYLAKRIKSSTLLAFRELGPEAIYKLEVKNFPLIVGIDSNGRSVYK